MVLHFKEDVVWVNFKTAACVGYSLKSRFPVDIKADQVRNQVKIVLTVKFMLTFTLTGCGFRSKRCG